MRAVRRLGDDAVELLHLRRAADDGAEAFLALHLLAQDAVLAGELQVAEHAVQDQAQLFQVEGLGDVVVGALLHRLHRRLHAGVAGHDDDDRLRTPPLDLFAAPPGRPRRAGADPAAPRRSQVVSSTRKACSALSAI